jgi:hypothetical protein
LLTTTVSAGIKAVITNEDSIRARRRLTNKFIAAHQAERLRPFFDPAIKLITGDGSWILGVDAVVGAFDAQFRDADFVAYERVTTSVAADADGLRAAEHGTWTATWRNGAANGAGVYLACWRRVVGQWVIESELYITLA